MSNGTKPEHEAVAYEPIDILYVEDSPEDRELTIRALRKQNLANHLHIARDGDEALQFLFPAGSSPARSIKMILLDLKLPKVSGIEVLRRVKSSDELRTIPVVVLTSSKEEPDVRACYELGANSYIVKPVDFAKLTAAVSQIGLYWLLVNTPPNSTG